MPKPVTAVAPDPPRMPGQVVLVLQGGGALGAYQVGVYQALHEAGIEPAWVIGTSIGAINGGIIAGNPPEQRLAHLQAFWQRMERPGPFSAVADGGAPWLGGGLGGGLRGRLANVDTLLRGIPGFFTPSPLGALWPTVEVGAERAAYYDTSPLRHTLADLVDFTWLNARHTRLTVGAVNVCSGALRYFDSREETLGVAHLMASGALPPAFPAVRVDGEPYWDGGIYSNTPLEAVFDDRPRRDAVIFAVNMWHPRGAAPESVWQAIGRQKDIQYASRADSHIRRQHQLHRLRHIIGELGRRLPPEAMADPQVRELLGYGCTTRMHVVRLLAPRLDGEDVTKDIDFTAGGIEARWQAGRDDAWAVIRKAPWNAPMDPLDGVVIHDPEHD